MESELKLLTTDEIPRLLREIPDPPHQLYVRGSLPSDDATWIAVVGSRACTEYGKEVTRFLLSGLRGCNVVIVSGLAFGIDAAAHRAALDAQLPTVAVPGSGLDWSVLYPRTHVTLAQHILESGGALISEYEPLQKAAPYTFPRRNRIMAGMSHATLVIEAKEKSGTLITARLAVDYNRELLVVPGSILSSASAGSHQFLKLGATPVTEPEDILQALHLSRAEHEESNLEVTPLEAAILKRLEEPLTRDTLIAHLGQSPADIGSTLSTLEIRGLIIVRGDTIRRA